MDWVKILSFILVGSLRFSAQEGTATQPSKQDIVSQPEIAKSGLGGLGLSQVPLPISQETLPVLNPEDLLPKEIKDITELNIDIAALYSIIRNILDSLREHCFSRLRCKKGVCQYPILPEVFARNTKYYVTAKRFYSVFVIITLVPREVHEDRVIYQVDLDNILKAQLTKQLLRVGQFMPCNKRICYVPPKNYKNCEDSSYCNYQGLTKSCVFVSTNIIIDFEDDFDNNANLELGVAINTGISLPL